MADKDLSKIIAETEKEERKDQDSLEEQFLKSRIDSLKKAGKTQKQIDEQLEKDAQEKQRYNRLKNGKEERAQRIKNLEDAAKAAATVEEQKLLEREALKLKNAEVIADKLKSTISNLGSNLYDSVTKSAEKYGSLLTNIQTRLLGSGKTYSSVADMISRTFAGSPFFKMSTAMENVQRFVQQGISYNVELRATLQTVSEKMAQTFDALDATLLRVVRIQQQDSTAARLGIETALTKFLNNQYQDTSYLTSGISKSVSAALIEAESRMGVAMATEFEYETQKWLGALYSVGASQNLINQLAQGIGYLGSGNISSLTSNSALTNLLVSAANRGGGRSFGDMITGAAGTEDISALILGLRSLVSEVSKTENVVALNQYAQVFGMTVSDLQSILNLTSDDLQTLTNATLTYNDAIKTVNDNLTFSSLFSRTAGSELFGNIYQNMIDVMGSSIGSSAGAMFAWKLTGYLSEFLNGIEVTVSPFGVGANMDLGKFTKSAAVMGAMIGNIGSLLGGLSNLAGVHLDLENVKSVERGSLGMSSVGKTQSYSQYVGDTSKSSIYEQSNLSAKSNASQVTDQSLDKEQESLGDMQNKLDNIDNNIEIMVRLMNSDGIVIRGRAGEAPVVNFFNNQVGFGGIFQG